MSEYRNTPRFKHIAKVLKFGIIPNGWNVEYSDKGEPYYISPHDTIYYEHPLSSADVDDLAVDEEILEYMTPVVGATHPAEYLPYRPKDWKMSKAFNEQTPYPPDLRPEYVDVLGHPAVRVLLAAIHHFKVFDVGDGEKLIEFSKICKEEMTKEKASGATRLYHPSDVKTTFPFQWETMISNAARRFGRDLILLTPEIKKDETNWYAAWNRSSAQRPAMRFRYSTGVQENLPPLIVGAAPSTAKPSTRRAYWFFVTPRSDDAKKLVNSWTGRFNWTMTYPKHVGLNDISLYNFQGVTVAAHRALVLKEISENHLGPWMNQYANYVMKNEKVPINVRPRFYFNPGAKYTGGSVTHAEIAACIFTSGPNSDIRRFTKAWDNLIEALDNSMAPVETDA